MARKIFRSGLLLSVLAVCGCSLVHAVRLATDKETIATAMTADKTFPQLSQEIRYVNLFATEMAKYVDAADSECTMFAPDNTAIQKTMTGLGSYVGLFLQNQTMQKLVLNHHVIPGSIVKAAGFGDGSKAVPYTTRANQTIWLLQRNGQPYVAFGEKYVVPVQIADIPNKRNKCVLHIIDEQTLIPPSLLSTFEDWQQKAGKPGALNSPKSAWVADLPSAATAKEAAKAPAAAADAPAAAAATKEAASKPTSGASSAAAGRCIVAAAAAAALLLAL
uniref:FAS1 domain-containing protein n=1 Tax=Tetradesmus obliquus TaxID=3088 RepID=A0A383WMV6_TETOB|eukprot:jgi/Sobl393_1/627/SZX78509.1